MKSKKRGEGKSCPTQTRDFPGEGGRGSCVQSRYATEKRESCMRGVSKKREKRGGGKRRLTVLESLGKKRGGNKRRHSTSCPWSKIIFQRQKGKRGEGKKRESTDFTELLG